MRAHHKPRPMHAAHYSSLLPEVFRHKTTRVRVPRPRAVLMDFHGTLSERRWEDKVIYPYVKRAVGGFLRDNWQLESVQRCLDGLRNESFEQRFRNKFDDAPVINEPVDGEEELVAPAELAKQMADFIVWQLEAKKATRETQIVERLVWQDGLRRAKILTPIFSDVLPCVRTWRNQHKCAIFVISSLERDTLKLLFENTTSGNLDQYVSDYVSTKPGDKLVSDAYRRYYESLHLDGAPSNASPLQAAKGNQSAASSKADRIVTESPYAAEQESQQLANVAKCPSTSSPFEHIARPVLFLTDSGQEAKAASLVDDGRAFECVLVNRLGNKPIRTYYLSQFQYVEKFDDIEFVH